MCIHVVLHWQRRPIQGNSAHPHKARGACGVDVTTSVPRRQKLWCAGQESLQILMEPQLNERSECSGHSGQEPWPGAAWLRTVQVLLVSEPCRKTHFCCLLPEALRNAVAKDILKTLWSFLLFKCSVCKGFALGYGPPVHQNASPQE